MTSLVSLVVVVMCMGIFVQVMSATSSVLGHTVGYTIAALTSVSFNLVASAKLIFRSARILLA